MNKTKEIGICMDYHSAHIMEFSKKPKEIAKLESEFVAKMIKKEMNKGEEHLHFMAKQCKMDYFKKIAAIILKYEIVLLFGPTDAKSELFDMLADDDHFFKIKAYLKETGKMNLNQRNKFLQEHFLSQ